MVNLDKETIEAIKKIEKAVDGTNFEINKFEVSDSAIAERTIINLDIRRKVEEGQNESEWNWRRDYEYWT